MEDHEKFFATLSIEGERGKLFVSNPLAPHFGHRLELTVDGSPSRWSVK